MRLSNDFNHATRTKGPGWGVTIIYSPSENAAGCSGAGEEEGAGCSGAGEEEGGGGPAPGVLTEASGAVSKSVQEERRGPLLASRCGCACRR